jgi:hypothetical protein
MRERSKEREENAKKREEWGLKKYETLQFLFNSLKLSHKLREKHLNNIIINFQLLDSTH